MRCSHLIIRIDLSVCLLNKRLRKNLAYIASTCYKVSDLRKEDTRPLEDRMAILVVIQICVLISLGGTSKLKW